MKTHFGMNFTQQADGYYAACDPHKSLIYNATRYINAVTCPDCLRKIIWMLLDETERNVYLLFQELKKQEGK